MSNKQKRGQIGETTTWIVATLIIVVILAFTIVISTTKIIGDKEISSFTEEDMLVTKSLFSYVLTSDDMGESVYILLGEGDFNEFSGDLAIQISDLYSEEYGSFWLGVRPETSNDYFGKRPGRVPEQDITFASTSIEGILERIKLEDGHTLELYIPKAEP